MACFDAAFCLIKKTWGLALENPDNLFPWWRGQGSPPKAKAASDTDSTHLESEEWWYLRIAEIYSHVTWKTWSIWVHKSAFSSEDSKMEESAFSGFELHPTFRCGRSQHSNLDKSDPGRTVLSTPTDGASVLPAGALCALAAWAPALGGGTAVTKQRVCNAGAGHSRPGASWCFSLCLKRRPELCCLMAKAELALSHSKAVTASIRISAKKLQSWWK